MFSFKLQKIKKYLNKNLLKNFITFSKTFHFSLILFALKINEDLYFYVDYRKLNVMIKRNRYLLSLIKEIIKKIMSYKHLTRLNIIVIFNKFRIHLDSEDIITFIIALCQNYTEQVNVDMIIRKLKLRRKEGLAFEKLLMCVSFSSAKSYVISVII